MNRYEGSGYYEAVGSDIHLEDVSLHSRSPLHNAADRPSASFARTPPLNGRNTRKYHTPSHYLTKIWNRVILLNFKIRIPKPTLGARVGKKHWNVGLIVGFYASLAVLITNIALLIYSALRHKGSNGGISTVAIGNTGYTTRISTVLHVLINALSTVLLTTSNYAMQILCAPTRKELDRVHRDGKWMEIGLISIHNLRHINKSRAILWFLLAASSVPLHLFYNSAVLATVSGQDYTVEALRTVPEDLLSESSGWKYLTNEQWVPIYSEQYISGDFGDLLLLIDRASSTVKLHPNLTFSVEAPTSSSCSWRQILYGEEQVNISIPTTFDYATGELVPSIGSVSEEYRVVFDIPFDPGSADLTPLVPWPHFNQVNVTDSKLSDVLTICPSYWISNPGNSSYHVNYAYAKSRQSTSKVQVALPFLGVVIFMNVVKVICLFLTLRACSSPHVVTVGDAVSTYLESPEAITGRSMLSKIPFAMAYSHLWQGRWSFRRKRTLHLIANRKGWTILYLVLALAATFTSMALAFAKSGSQRAWGTNSTNVIPFTKTSFDAKGAVLVAWLSNVPQVFLSLVYFFINRICTTICFAKEWNDYASQRKGLRVTVPVGDQRSTYFLQLPYRWAFPLTAFSGVLHWLLSQSLFLVRREALTRDGKVYPNSTCACGYSAPSLAAFFGAFCLLVGWVVTLLREKLPVRIPPTGNCSMLISAACHPPADDIDAHLRPVQWGVVVEGTESTAGHCTFTSMEVTEPKKGCLYGWEGKTMDEGTPEEGTGTANRRSLLHTFYIDNA